MGHFGTASTGSWHGYCRTEKEQSAFARGRKRSFYSKVPLPDLPLIEFDDAMSIGNSTIDVQPFSFFRLYPSSQGARDLLAFLYYVPDPQCPVRVE